jgi:HNH endonuclease
MVVFILGGELMAQVKTPTKLRMTQRDFERFMSKVIIDQDTGCWLWGEMGTGAIDYYGYGQGSIKSKRVQVHRAVYEFCTGSDIPEGLELDHTCEQRNCCNWAHMEVVTKLVNLERRGWHRAVKARIAPKQRRLKVS